MRQSKRFSYKAGWLRRMMRESLLLSYTSALSAKIVSAFENGFASPMLSSVKKVNKFVNNNVNAVIEEKVGFKRRVVYPVRNAVASFFAKNRFFAYLGRLKDRFLNISLRSVGVFLLTFGIYAAAVYVLRQYVSGIGTGSPTELSVATVSFISGLLFLFFGEKSILSALGTSRITGYLLNTALGVNRSSFNRESKGVNAIGMAFLAGSICGIFTIFFSSARILLTVFITIVFLSIFNVPEFGLLLSALMLPFVSVSVITPVLLTTTVAYLFKCIRLKRNFRFGSADFAVCILFVIKAVFALSRGGDTNTMLCFVCIYFLVKNMICSERLISDALNTLCIGVSVGVLLWLLGEYASYISLDSLRTAASALSGYTFDNGSFAIVTLPVIPVSISRMMRRGTRIRGAVTLALIAVFTVVCDDPMLYMLDIIAVLIYFMSARKAPVGALLAGAIVLPPAALIASHNTFAAIDRFVSLSEIFSETVGENASGIAKFGAVIAGVFMLAAVLLAFQRILACLRVNNARSVVNICGGIAASAVMVLVAMFFVGPLADIRSFALLWFIFGLTGSAYGVYYREDTGSEVKS